MHLLERIRSHISRGSFGRNVLTLMGGTALAQLIGAALIPILTRIYSPLEFGVYAPYAALLAVLAVLVNGRYELAIVLPKKREDALSLVALSAIITVVVSAAILPISAGFGREIAGWLGAEELSGWLWMLPVSLLGCGLFQAASYWHTRNQSFKRLSAAKVGHTATMSAAQMGLGSAMPTIGAAGLICGQAIGQWVAALMLTAGFGKTGRSQEFIKAVNAADLKRVARRYSRFPRFLLLSHVINSLAPQLPIFVISHVSSSLLGLFALTVRLMGVPFTLIGSSVSQVFFAEAATQFKERGSCYPVYRRTISKLILLAFLLFAPLSLLGDGAYRLILGENWTGLAAIVRALIPLFFFRLVASPVSPIFVILERTDIDLYFQILFVLCSLGGLLLGKLLGGGMAYIYCYSALMSAAYVANILLSYLLARKSSRLAATKS